MSVGLVSPAIVRARPTVHAMPTVSVEKLEPGMVVKSDVRDPLDRLLIAAGTVVTARHAPILQKWGIKAIEIKGDDLLEKEKIVTPEAQDQAVRSTQSRFRHVDLAHPFMAELMSQCVSRKARLLATEVPRDH
jgi:hypothetical protein